MSARLPDLAWAHEAAAGRLDGLGWAAAAPGLEQEPYTLIVDPNGATRFHGEDLSARLPPPMAEAARAVSEAGGLPLVEAVGALLARPSWLIHSRRTLFGPLSPAPRLLEALVEAYGIGVEIHRGDPETLARLVARLPGWHPSRGTLERALHLLEEAVGEPVRTPCAQLGPDGVPPVAPDLREEVLAARPAAWWALRATADAAPSYRISSGFVRFQAASTPYRLLREDVVIAPDGPLSAALPRLLPVWTSTRVVV